jgi:hypothetical protein
VPVANTGMFSVSSRRSQVIQEACIAFGSGTHKFGDTEMTAEQVTSATTLARGATTPRNRKNNKVPRSVKAH